MVFKLMIVILTLLVIKNGAQRFDTFDIDPNNFHKYNFIKHLFLKRDGETNTNDETSQKPDHTFCPSYFKICNNLPHKSSSKREFKTFMDYQDFLRSIPRDIMSIMTDEYEDNNIAQPKLFAK